MCFSRRREIKISVLINVAFVFTFQEKKEKDMLKQQQITFGICLKVIQQVKF